MQICKAVIPWVLFYTFFVTHFNFQRTFSWFSHSHSCCLHESQLLCSNGNLFGRDNQYFPIYFFPNLFYCLSVLLPSSCCMNFFRFLPIISSSGLSLVKTIRKLSAFMRDLYQIGKLIHGQDKELILQCHKWQALQIKTATVLHFVSNFQIFSTSNFLTKVSILRTQKHASITGILWYFFGFFQFIFVALYVYTHHNVIAK